jgi:tetratricopeptide (TPR) repeat protein
LFAASFVDGAMHDALTRTRRMLASSYPDDPADIRNLAHRLVGFTLVTMGQFAESATHLQEGLALYDPVRHADHTRRYGADPRVNGLAYLATARWCQGEVDAALAHLDTALASSREIEVALARCHGLTAVCIIRTVIDPANAGGVVEEAITSCQKYSAQFWHALAQGLRAGVRLAQGDHRGALDDAMQGRSLLDRGGARYMQPLILGFAAQAQIVLERFEDAAASLRDIDVMIEAGQRMTESDTCRIEGELMLARGDAAAAEACWRRAIAVARAQGAASWELRAATRLARLLADRGARDEAAALLATTFAQIDGGHGTPDVIAAAALLRDLRADR